MVEELICRKYFVTSPYTGVNTIKRQILHHKAAVVIDHTEADKFLGIITAEDIVKRPYNLVIDCMSLRPELEKDTEAAEILNLMIEHQTDVLPIVHEGCFEGVVYKDDIIKLLNAQKVSLEKTIEEKKNFIVEQTRILEDLAFNQAHILRKPIANLIGLVQLFELLPTPHEKQEIINKIGICTQEMDSILKQLHETVSAQLAVHSEK